jgi:hypothetical protein
MGDTALTIPEEARRVLSTAPISPIKLAHLVLRTPQYEKLCSIYKLLLNATPAFENDMLCFLRYDDEHHRVVLLNLPPLAPRAFSAGVEHFAFTYSTLGDLLGNYQRMKAAGIAPVWCINHGMNLSIYYEVPDRNLIETQIDTMDNASADAYMSGAYFARNPIGVDFDPELLIERFQRGDMISELLRQGSAPYPPGVMPPQPPGLPPYDFRGELL